MMDENRVDFAKAGSLLKKRVNSRMPGPGDYETGLAGVKLYRRDQAKKAESCFYRPLIVKVVQGDKRALIGSEEYRYGENEVMVTGVDMPGASMICEASPGSPCTSIVIELDRNLLAQLALEMPNPPYHAGPASRGILVQALEADMLDAFLRLAELLDTPERLAVIGPMIVKEIHYRLLTGPNGYQLRSFHTHGSQSNQVAQAILWLKQNLATAVQIEELAEKVNMASSTFHRHFKEITTLSPLQYQKRLRLHEAQRLMLTDDLDATSASAAVGYESLSQFNREYKRLFGAPPRRDVKRLQDDRLPARPAPRETLVEMHGF
jgi:AraC-like DNA-binding protein